MYRIFSDLKDSEAIFLSFFFALVVFSIQTEKGNINLFKQTQLRFLSITIHVHQKLFLNCFSRNLVLTDDI